MGKIQKVWFIKISYISSKIFSNLGKPQTKNGSLNIPNYISEMFIVFKVIKKEDSE